MVLPLITYLFYIAFGKDLYFGKTCITLEQALVNLCRWHVDDRPARVVSMFCA